MKLPAKTLLTTLLVVAATNTHALDTGAFTIDHVQMKETGYVFIHSTTALNVPVSCNTANSQYRIVVRTEHPSFDAIVATALAAKATGTQVEAGINETITPENPRPPCLAAYNEQWPIINTFTWQ